jgi:trehalose 6-phosphate synthase
MGSADLVVASNRGPVSFSFDDSGKPVAAGSAGGLAAALEPLLRGRAATWVSCAMSEADRSAGEQGLMRTEGIELRTVEPDPSVYRMAYDLVSNSTLWFCHHHLFDLSRRPRFDRFWADAWEGYRQLNESFVSVVSDAAAEGATVLVQDYHLCLLPKMLAGERPDLRCVHFTHTPFADPSIFRVLPDSAGYEILAGLAASAACGFHTTRWEQAFRACCADHDVGAPRTFVSPLVPDPARLAARVASRACQEAQERIETLVGDRQTVLCVDRVEPSKNLLRGLWAFDELLRSRPDLRGQVVMLALAYPSRQGLPEYLAYETEIEQTARVVNESWSTADWSPVVIDIADDSDRSFAALVRYDVLLVNPIRDGLNLVAKEGPLVNATHGVLVLSREAGSFAELGEEALGVNPIDVVAIAGALARAVDMPAAERKRRSESLRALVTRRPPVLWLEDQLAAAGG